MTRGAQPYRAEEATVERTTMRLIGCLLLGACLLHAAVAPAVETLHEHYQTVVALYDEGKMAEAVLASWDTQENRENAEFGTVLGGSHYHLGEILFAEDRHAEAANHYQAAIDFFATYKAESYYHLGLGKLYRKDYSGALATLGELVAGYPNSVLAAQGMHYRAVTLQLMGDRSAAASAFGEMAKRYPQHAWSKKALERSRELGSGR